MMKENPDSSNDFEKYPFDEIEIKWILEKVKRAFEKCGKYRWLNAENQWKKYYLKCYKELNL